MKEQPDFEKQFFEYFGGKPRRVTYRIRTDSNGGHDRIYLNSLIYDATCYKKDFRLRGKRLTIQMNRFARELPTAQDDTGIEYLVANCRLIIWPVWDLEWHYKHGEVPTSDGEYFIGGVKTRHFEVQPKDDSREITVDGWGWSLTMRAPIDDYNIVLRDLEVPYLYSERYPDKFGKG